MSTAPVPVPAGVVTPEAVRLEFQAAGIGSRCVALLLDWMIQGTAMMIVLLAAGLATGVGMATGMPGWIGVTIALVLVSAIIWGYPTAFETLWAGRTPGKAALGLRVVTTEGAPVGFRHAAIRAAMVLVDFLATAGAAAVLSALLTRQHQRLGDLVAGTIVLRERTGAHLPGAVRFQVPPGGEGYAATLDPAVLSAEEYQAVRGFLMRAGELKPAARAELALQLARPLADRLNHQPPGNVTPELFLLCLAARYQQRRSAVGWNPPPAM